MMKAINTKLLDMQLKFKDYYAKNLGEKFVLLEQKRYNYLRVFFIRLFYYLLVDAAIIYDFMQGERFTIYIAYALLPMMIMWRNKYSEEPHFCAPFLIGTALLLVYHLFPSSIQELNEYSSKGRESLGKIFFAFLFMQGFLIWWVTQNYKEDTKRLVMQKVMDFFGTFNYAYQQLIDDAIITKSCIFSHYTDRVGDDFFKGSYKDVKITVSEEKHKRSNGKNTYTTFRGIIIELQMNKNFSGQTIVLKDSIFNGNTIVKNRTLSLIKSSVSQITLERAELEDINFEKKFDVYTTDQIEARYLLTPIFMESMMKLKKMYHGKKIQFSFYENKLIISISTNKDMFETTSLFYNTARYGKMSEVVRQFYYIFEIIEILRLNKK